MKTDPHQLMHDLLRLSYVYTGLPVSLSLLLVAIAAPYAIQSTAPVEIVPENSIPQRVESIRERLRHAAPIPNEDQPPQTLAQWYNWANGWSNWRNY